MNRLLALISRARLIVLTESLRVQLARKPR